MTPKQFDKTVTEAGRQEMRDEIKINYEDFKDAVSKIIGNSMTYYSILNDESQRKVDEILFLFTPILYQQHVLISALELWVKEAEIIINGVNNLRDIIEIKEATQEHEGEAQAVYKLLSDVDSYLSQTKQG